MHDSSISVIGRGRMGTALSAALHTPAPLGRGSDGNGADVVLLCVPDAEIAAAAACIPPGPLVGHCSGASTLAPLLPHQAFSLHPLMTVPSSPAAPIDFGGVCFAVAGTTPHAANTARRLTIELGGRPIAVDDDDRAAYHAAERLLATAGVERDALLPLVRATVENWAVAGDRALTGPIARGDEATVAIQRSAIEQRAPDLLDLFDALAEATRALADRPLTRA